MSYGFWNSDNYNNFDWSNYSDILNKPSFGQGSNDYASDVGRASGSASGSGVTPSGCSEPSEFGLNFQYRDWKDTTYTDGFGNTWDMQVRCTDGNNFEYRFSGDSTVYNNWNDVAKDMAYTYDQMNSSGIYDAQSNSFGAKPGDYIIDGLTFKVTLDGKYNGGLDYSGKSINFSLGAVNGSNNNYGYGFNITYRF